MRVAFSAKLKETNNCKGIWLNSIQVQKQDGTVVTLDRDKTEYFITADGHNANVVLKDVYTWDYDKNVAIYDLNREDFTGAVLYDYELEDDTGEDYELVIDEKSFWIF